MYGNDKHYENGSVENYIKIVIKNSGKSSKGRFSTVFYLTGNCSNRYAYFFAKSFIIAAIF